MNFVFLSTPTFEPWDWTNPDIHGIGGSETSHIEMSNRLADRGHAVYSYAPTGFTGPVVNQHNVIWERCDHDPRLWDRKGVWIIYRDPEMVDGVQSGNTTWLICQDVDYPGKLTRERVAKFTRIVALCPAHAGYLQTRYPYAADKICVSSNGVKAELIRKVLVNSPERNPKRLIYASSPDRGLLYLAAIFQRAKELVPDLELHVYYGFDNIDKILSKLTKSAQRKTNDIKRLLDQPGIEYHGRMGQPKLAIEWVKAGIWCHPSSFAETSCITCMDAQALGAVPITTPTWAIGDNVRHGVFVEGDPYNDQLVRSRYVMEVVRMALDPDRQKAIRQEMMPWALEHFTWENFVDQWESWAEVDTMEQYVEASASTTSQIEVELSVGAD